MLKMGVAAARTAYAKEIIVHTQTERDTDRK